MVSDEERETGKIKSLRFGKIVSRQTYRDANSDERYSIVISGEVIIMVEDLIVLPEADYDDPLIQAMITFWSPVFMISPGIEFYSANSFIVGTFASNSNCGGGGSDGGPEVGAAV